MEALRYSSFLDSLGISVLFTFRITSMLEMRTLQNDKTTHCQTANAVLVEQGSSRKALGVAPL